MFDIDEVEALLVSRAVQRQTVSYSEALRLLGHAFSRPKMRALCRVLEQIDSTARGRGEPELAVLVVRETDGLPGQGWWAGARTAADGYTGPWEGPAARSYVSAIQSHAFRYWSDRRAPSDG